MRKTFLLSGCILLLAAIIFFANGCPTSCFSNKNSPIAKPLALDTVAPIPKTNDFAFAYIVPHDVRVKSYFYFMDTLLRRLDTLVAYDLNEYLLARTNPWLIDSFVETDYDHRKARGEFVYDQKQLLILRAGDTLFVPADSLAAKIKAKQAKTWLDVNLPEFKMRIVEGADTLFSFPVRIGQNRKQYLEVLDRTEDLRTKTGVGAILRVNRSPSWTNPVTGKKYKDTGRDDGQRTQLPQVPWLEPALNGFRWGQMIHPTTNSETLGKTYSNGCIGTAEADAWRVYFYAPVGTKVVVRNDRRIISPKNDTIWLKDVYDPKKFKRRVL